MWYVVRYIGRYYLLIYALIGLVAFIVYHLIRHNAEAPTKGTAAILADKIARYDGKSVQAFVFSQSPNGHQTLSWMGTPAQTSLTEGSADPQLVAVLKKLSAYPPGYMLKQAEREARAESGHNNT